MNPEGHLTRQGSQNHSRAKRRPSYQLSLVMQGGSNKFFHYDSQYRNPRLNLLRDRRLRVSADGASDRKTSSADKKRGRRSALSSNTPKIALVDQKLHFANARMLLGPWN
jgi:hypothetical protein